MVALLVLAGAARAQISMLGLEVAGPSGVGSRAETPRTTSTAERVVLPVSALPAADWQSDRANPCGPYAVLAVLRYAGRATSCYEAVARALTPDGKIGSGPVAIMRVLLDAGLTVDAGNPRTAEAVAAAIRNGNPVLALVDAGGTPHWAVVKGFEATEGRPGVFYLEDTYYAVGQRASSGEALPDGHRMDAATFDRIWSRPIAPQAHRGLVNWAAGFSRYAIVAHLDGKGNAAPPERSVSPASMFAASVNDVGGGIRDGNLARSASGLGEGLSGLVLGAGYLAGLMIKNAGELAGSAFRKLGGAAGPGLKILGTPLGALGKALSWLGHGATELTGRGLALVAGAQR